MKKVVSCIFALSLFFGFLPVKTMANEGDIEINSLNFPDATFRQYVFDNFDTDQNNLLSADERTILCA
ncbi:MAG: hypothetical protein HUJ53_11185 [Holdemanella sp.]|nr:hypothetical protein [Holdemanella sp.]